jgi:thiamine biosynthesis protein ThiI
VNVILVRYAELGLKSPGVRRHFETILLDNLKAALTRKRVEALVSREAGRIYVHTDRIDDAMDGLVHVFGVASISPAIECTSDMEDMQRTAAEMSRAILGPGMSFAVKARREGSHPFTSMDVGREVGSAIFLANEDRNVRVDLTDPDVTIYVEVRGGRAFIFDRYIPGPGGLPLGSQGKVVASVHSELDALAAWMLMKRGCKVLIWGDEHANVLEPWDPRLKVLESGSLEEAVHGSKALGIVSGRRLEDIDLICATDIGVPAFYPLIGMTEQEVEERLESIRK